MITLAKIQFPMRIFVQTNPVISGILSSIENHPLSGTYRPIYSYPWSFICKFVICEHILRSNPMPVKRSCYLYKDISYVIFSVAQNSK